MLPLADHAALFWHMRRVLSDTLSTRGVTPAVLLLLLLCWRGVTTGLSVPVKEAYELLSAEKEPYLNPVKELLLVKLPGPGLQQAGAPRLQPCC
jgi:hypothetical protein